MNIVEQVEQSPLGNTNQRKKGRKYAFTLNNYTEDEYLHIINYCIDKKWKYCIGKEIGGKNKVKHLQGYIETGNPISFNTIKKLLPKAHIERAFGTSEQNFAYCSKDKNVKKSLTFQEKIDKEILDNEYKNITWRNWQKDVLKIILSKPDSRTINWFWEPIGKVGKSFLTKYIDLIYDVILADGKKDNIFNQIKISMDAEKIPRIIILDIPRHNIDYVNYGVLEQIKNGLIYSGKYEGGKCRFPHPHVIIFANSTPIQSKLSLDRWNIYPITVELENTSTMVDPDWSLTPVAIQINLSKNEGGTAPSLKLPYAEEEVGRVDAQRKKIIVNLNLDKL